MQQLENGTRVYSHTSLSLWRLCHRRWHNRYLLGRKEARSAAAAFSVHLVHEPLAEITRGNNVDWDGLWKAFLSTLAEEQIVAHKLHSLGTAQRIFEKTRDVPKRLGLSIGESERFFDFGQARYTSRADAIGGIQGRNFTVDYKYSQAKWKSAREAWPLKPLKPYDDQLLGQAICAETDSFSRVSIRVNPITGQVADPVVEDRMVDAKLRQEWLVETETTIEEIERRIREDGPWEKNDGSCHAFNRDCGYIRDCSFGR